MMAKLTLRDMHPRASKLDNIPTDALRADREQMSVGVMAQKYDVSKSTMYRALRKAGLIEHGEQAKSQQ